METFAFSDHHHLSESEHGRILEAAKRTEATMILTTEKDLARIKDAFSSNLRALRLETIVDQDETFLSLLERTVS